MKKIIKVITFTLIIGFFNSCSIEDDQVQLQSEVTPEDLEVPEIAAVSKPTNKAILIPPKITKVWNNQNFGESLFVLDESVSKIVYERNSWDNSTIFTFRQYSESSDFIYIIDDNRDLHMALPLWNPGEYSYAWMKVGSGSWSTWRRVSYSSCISDTEAPTISANSQAPQWYESYLRNGGINFSNSTLCIGGVGGNPPGLTDYSTITRFYLNIQDNCDQNIGYIQNPPAGTPIESNRFINGYIDFFDNNGNTRRINFQDYVRVCD
ncbi:hypothetical protein [Aquimarina pacifica]|uniref:hypothetical protein n=1 Tax=Aquimarina pacifica TaxID=1296415 RepID=UPI000470C6DF|nr:hypothetical protein [Aquimarina pacifica]